MIRAVCRQSFGIAAQTIRWFNPVYAVKLRILIAVACNSHACKDLLKVGQMKLF